MFYSIDGNIVKLEGGFPQRKVKTLTYQVKGNWFPHSYYNFNNPTNVINGNEKIEFIGNEPNSVTINYGDGETYIKEFELVGAEYKVGYNLGDETMDWVIPQHTFQDSNQGLRNVTFEFEKPLSLSEVVFGFVKLFGSLPSEIDYFLNIRELLYRFVSDVETIPDSIPLNLEEYSLGSSLKNKSTKLIDSFFSSKLETLDVSGSFDLSNNISSNFFKINQLKGTLKSLIVKGCNVVEFPQSLYECSNIVSIQSENNDFLELPYGVNDLSNLQLFYIGSTADTASNPSLPVWDNLKKLRTVYLGFLNLNFSEIPNSWKYLYSLVNFVLFREMVDTNQRFDEFIEHFYTLCTNEGSIVQDDNAFGGEYPHRFRNISWGYSSLTPTGTYQAPTGFVQGVSNGNPANEAEKIYVLVNNYGHTVTFNQP